MDYKLQLSLTTSALKIVTSTTIELTPITYLKISKCCNELIVSSCSNNAIAEGQQIEVTNQVFFPFYKKDYERKFSVTPMSFPKIIIYIDNALSDKLSMRNLYLNKILKCSLRKQNWGKLLSLDIKVDHCLFQQQLFSLKSF